MRTELFKFETVGGSWAYSSDKKEHILLGVTYQPEPISRQRYKATQRITQNDMTIEVARTNTFVQNYLSSHVRAQISVTIHHEISGEWAIIWKGRVIDVSLSGHKARITCESIFTSIARPGLRLRYQSLCPHSLFFAGCNVDRFLFQLMGNITQAAGDTLTVPEAAAKPDGYFNSGFLIWKEMTELMIYSHIGSQLVVDTAFNQIGPVLIYPGCNHTMDHCESRFNNLLNFGGDPYIPTHTPFGGLKDNIGGNPLSGVPKM